jgi:regulatory protein
LASVSEHPRKPGRYRVRLADGRAWLVDADAVGLLPALRAGAALERDLVEQLESAHRFVAVFDRALGALARARRTRRELARRLAAHEPDADLVERALARLEALGLLDDAAVARAEAASRFKRGEGTGRVRQALMRKGVDRSAVDDAVRTVAGEEEIDEAALCRSAAEKRLRALRSYAPEVQRRRLTGFLLRRGFGGGLVSDVVRRVLRDASGADD